MAKLSMIVLLLAWFVTPAHAQFNRPMECWNANARHFEGVRPGETQNDLDFSRCRPIGQYRVQELDVPRECWNPRAGHYEGVRRGERQDDLDFTRCRQLVERSERRLEPVPPQVDRRGNNVPRECWNPRAGHFEGVREGERQDDLDFRNCHPIYERGRRFDAGWECWNPRARHFEDVRAGERQDDLDMAHCRPRQ